MEMEELERIYDATEITPDSITGGLIATYFLGLCPEDVKDNLKSMIEISSGFTITQLERMSRKE